MKKLFLLPLIAGFALSGCSLFGGGDSGDYDINPSISGGTKAQKTAILEAINTLSPCVGRASQDYFPDVPIVLEEAPNQAAGGCVRVTTKQVYQDETVELEWYVDESQPTFRAFRETDGEHKMLEVKYPGFGNPDTSISWVLKSVKCGKAKTDGDSVVSYTAKITARTHSEEPMTIAQINEVKDEAQTIKDIPYPSTFERVDYTLDSPYFSVIDDGTNAEYHYVAVKGKVIYYAPDGNWMLLGDGDQVVEVYAGAGTALTPKNFPSIADDYIVVHGNLSQYKGNIQIGFVTSIETLTAAEKATVSEPVLTGKTVDASVISSLELDASVYNGSQKQAVAGGFMNCIGKIEGTVDTNSIRIGDSTKTSKASAISANARFTFDVKLAGDKTIKVAYDYHTDSDASNGIFNALKNKLTTGGTIRLKGTMRYSGNNSKPFLVKENGGVWNIIPFSAADIS